MPVSRTSIVAKFGLDITALKAGLVKAKRSLSQFAGKLKGLFSGGLAVFGLGAGMAGTTREVINLGSKLSDLASGAQINIEKFQALGAVTRKAGASEEQLANALTKTIKAISEARQGVSTYTDAFDILGINVEEFNQLTPERRLEALAVSMKNAEDKTAATGAAMDILGTRNAPKLLEVLNVLGAEGFDEIERKARETGQVLSESDILKLDQLADDIDIFKRRFLLSFAEIVTAVKDLSNGDPWGINTLGLRVVKAVSVFFLKMVDGLMYVKSLIKATIQTPIVYAVKKFSEGMYDVFAVLNIKASEFGNYLISNLNKIPKVNIDLIDTEKMKDAFEEASKKIDENSKTLKEVFDEQMLTVRGTSFAKPIEDTFDRMIKGVEIAQKVSDVLNKENLVQSKKVVDLIPEATETVKDEIEKGADKLEEAGKKIGKEIKKSAEELKNSAVSNAAGTAGSTGTIGDKNNADRAQGYADKAEQLKNQGRFRQAAREEKKADKLKNELYKRQRERLIKDIQKAERDGKKDEAERLKKFGRERFGSGEEGGAEGKDIDKEMKEAEKAKAKEESEKKKSEAAMLKLFTKIESNTKDVAEVIAE